MLLSNTKQDKYHSNLHTDSIDQIDFENTSRVIHFLLYCICILLYMECLSTNQIARSGLTVVLNMCFVYFHLGFHLFFLKSSSLSICLISKPSSKTNKAYYLVTHGLEPVGNLGSCRWLSDESLSTPLLTVSSKEVTWRRGRDCHIL